MDYPRSDRHLSQAVRRLTRIHARSVEQPSISTMATRYSTGPGSTASRWAIGTYRRASPKLREYLLRGGFFMCDDFHGTMEWASLHRQHEPGISGPPDRGDLENDDPIFHTIYDLHERYQVPGEQFVRYRARTYEHDGSTRTGAASMTTRAGSWSPSATTWTWATPGSMPTIPSIRRSSPHSASGSA